MRSGRMRLRGELQEPTTTQGRHGAPRQTWTTYANRWGHIRWQTGREVLQSGQLQPRRAGVLTIRYTENLEPTHRYKVGSRIFHIHNVIDVDERHRWHECMVEEVV